MAYLSGFVDGLNHASKMLMRGNAEACDLHFVFFDKPSEDVMAGVNSTQGSTGSIYEGLGLNTTQSVREASSQVKDQTLTQEDFLLLLTTQLQAQDPTNPADNTELVSQMSQLSMVESLNSINSSMDGIIDQVQSSSALNATSLIGTYVYTDTNKGFFDGSNGVTWAIDAGDETYYDLQLTIKDATTGQVVYSDTADALTGEIKFAWPGIYSPEGPVDDPDAGIDDGTGTSDDSVVNPNSETADAGDGTDGTGDAGDGDESAGGAGDEGEGDKPQYELCAGGRYVLEVTGKTSSGESIQLPVKSLALVTSVTLGKTTADTMLSLYGAGEISFDKANKVTI
ncbi:MAG TPA: hypothetical protein H9898_10320 [Candidatus Anaerobiospirillum stercoravium]|nr:hypothetical protein [Candidatus Anaerobiospirillum stercoravium]